MGEHKRETRLCPVCGKRKNFPVRNQTCSRECAIQQNRSQSESQPGESHEYQGDTWTIRVRGARIKSFDDVVKHCSVDLEKWEVLSCKINKWEIGRRDKQVSIQWTKGKADGYVEDSGKIFVEPLIQVEVKLRLKVEKISAQTEIAELKKLAAAGIARQKIRQAKPSTGDSLLLEYMVPDLHVGRLALADETGWDNYNSQIAESVHDAALDSVIEKSSGLNFNKVLYVIGNDLLNFDNLGGTTTKGTPQATDTRYHQAFRIARNMLIRAIDRLRDIAPVYVAVIPGNHDALSSWHMGDSLEMFYHSYKDVNVDNSPTERKYFQFGQVMLMFTHGEGGQEDYGALMSVEQPKMFSETLFREVHIGHWHHVSVKEKMGIRTRTLPTLAAPDDWLSRKKHVGNVRGSEAYVWHKDTGLSHVFCHNVVQQRSQR